MFPLVRVFVSAQRAAKVNDMSATKAYSKLTPYLEASNKLFTVEKYLIRVSEHSCCSYGYESGV